MDINDLIAAVTEGLPADQAAIVKSAIERDAVKNKAAGWKQQSEFDALQTRLNGLQSELEGAPNKPGAKAYQQWYDKNYATVESQVKAIQAFDAKYGEGAFMKAAAGEPISGLPVVQQAAAGLSKDEIKNLLNEQFQSSFAPNIANVLKTTGTLVQKHMYAGRKNPIDFDAIDKIMGEKRIPIEAAYDEWDKPEREKVEASSREAEIKRRVDEEMQKRGAAGNFPSAADMTPGSLSARTKAETDKFDATALKRDLANTWLDSGTSKTN